jgi:hypothetical protein
VFGCARGGGRGAGVEGVGAGGVCAAPSLAEVGEGRGRTPLPPAKRSPPAAHLKLQQLPQAAAKRRLHVFKITQADGLGAGRGARGERREGDRDVIRL